MHILIVEDNPADVDLIRDRLPERGPVRYAVESVPRLSDALARLAGGGLDVVLLDLGLPDSQGLDTFRTLHKAAPGLAILVLTGETDLEIATRAVREGAQDYLVKGNTGGDLLVRALRYALERQRTEEALHRLNGELDRRVRERTEALTESRETLRGLLHRLEGAREEERTRVARDIHDDLGQNLTAIKMDLRSVEHALEKAGASAGLEIVKARTASAIELLNVATATVQKLATGLRPGVLDNLGLGPALRSEIRRFHARSGIACKAIVPDTLPDPAPAVATALFRIFQECLTNVARHSGATRMNVRLQAKGGDFMLRVHDNGSGIAEAALTHPQSLGLLGMKERAAMLGGAVGFRRGRKGGTVVAVRIPGQP